MEPLRLTAIEFIRQMASGRTRPLMLNCEAPWEDQFEVVVKLRGPELSAKTQISELIAAMLADDLGLQVPKAAIVDIPKGFEAAAPSREIAEQIRGSYGLNFGSVNLDPGFTTWPTGKNPHGNQKDQAADIFAFDTLIQNPDRRVTNPNLWVRSGALGVFDHEQAFSFLHLPILGGAPRPWIAADQQRGFPFLKEHVFFRGLSRDSQINFGPFKERLGRLTDEQLDAYAAAVPEEWKEENSLCEQITLYLKEARAQREVLIQFIQHLLR